MTVHATARRHAITAFSALILTANAIPGSSTGDTLELQDPDPANLRPGQIATIAGTGEAVEHGNEADAGDGEPAVDAPLGSTLWIDVGPDGKVYVADKDNASVRVIDPDGTIDTIPDSYVSKGQDSWGTTGAAADAEGRLYFSYGGSLLRADADGDVETITDKGSAPFAVGADDNLYFMGYGPDHRIRKITDDGTSTTIAGGGDLSIDESDGKDAPNAELNSVRNIAVDSKGTVYFTDETGTLVEEKRVYIRKVNPDGTISTIVDSGKPGAPRDEAEIGTLLTGMTMDANDNLLFIDQDNNVVRRVDPDGVITTIAPVWDSASDLAVGPEGNLYFAATGQVFVMGMNADGLPVDQSNDAAAEDSPGDDPWADEDPGTTLTVADEGFDVIADLDLTVGSDGSIYAVNVAGENQLVAVTLDGDVTAVAGGADGESPFDRAITAVETGAEGSVYLAAGGAVARIYSDGTWSVIAGGDGVQQPTHDGQLAGAAAMGPGIQLASAPDGRLYIADPLSSRVYELNPDGTLGIVAENAYNYPGGIAVSPDGDLYVSDPRKLQVRKIDSSGNGSRFAGSGDQSSSDDRGDGGPAENAYIEPHDVAVHPDGTVYISEPDAIRAVDTDGIINTVFEFDDPDKLGGLLQMLDFDAHGNLYFINRGDGEVQVLVRPAEISDPFPWWIVWVSAAAVVVLAGSVAVALRRRRTHVKTPTT